MHKSLINKVDLEVALKFVNRISIEKIGRELKLPEITIFSGTWQGMTYEQIANSSAYSANYLMRDIAPKFWKSLSEALGVDVGKSNFRLAIEELIATSEIESRTSQRSRLTRNSAEKIADWGNAPSLPSLFYGRTSEIETLQQWLALDSCQLLGLWGLCGMGKTLLMKKLAETVEAQYEIVIWRSLDKVSQLSELLKDLLYAGWGMVVNDPGKVLPQLIEQMRSHSCLILLDGLEAILKSQELSGIYQPGYEDYNQFLRAVGTSSHQSCLVFTSLENPAKIMPVGSNSNSLVRNFRLSGLSATEGSLLLKEEQIAANTPEQSLITYYQGNPALLTAVAQIIRELFNGNTEEFLGQKSLVFGEIERILGKSLKRISALEKEILYWLASETQPMTLSEIQNGIPLSLYPVESLEALESLSQRALIETDLSARGSAFSLSPAIAEYATNQLIAQIGNNFSIAKRQNFATENPIELGKTTARATNLGQWLNNRFELGWQPIAALFSEAQRSPARLRSAFNFRGEGVITRFKKVNLSQRLHRRTEPEPVVSISQNNSSSVLLLIAIAPENSALKICVQAQPTPQQQTLPANLQLSLQDEEETTLATIESKTKDNFIQLPYFRGLKTEKFKISLKLNSLSYEEDFII